MKYDYGYNKDFIKGTLTIAICQKKLLVGWTSEEFASNIDASEKLPSQTVVAVRLKDKWQEYKDTYIGRQHFAEYTDVNYWNIWYQAYKKWEKLFNNGYLSDDDEEVAVDFAQFLYEQTRVDRDVLMFNVYPSNK